MIRFYTFLVAGLCMCGAVSAATAAAQTETTTQAVQAATKPADHLGQSAGSAEVYASWFRSSTSAAYLYLKNHSDKPLTLAKLFVDGNLESADSWPLDPNRKTDWFDVLPRTLAAGQIGQVRVHLRNLVRTAPVILTAEMSDGTRTDCSITPTASLVLFDDITFAKDGSDVSLFAHTDAAIAQVFVDGTDVTAKCNMKQAAPLYEISAVYYHPDSALVRGSYHTWEVRTADNLRAIYTARTLSNDFIIGTYGKPDFAPYKTDAVNHYISFGLVPPAKFQELATLGMTGSFVPFVGGAIDGKTKEYKLLDTAASTERMDGVKGNPTVAYYSAPDEPDGSDYPLGIGTHGRSIVAMRELAASVDPATPCFVQIDNTYRNQNYHVYAETMDYCASHRYNLGQDFLEGDRDGLKQLRDAASPLPYLWVTQLYPIREKIGEHSKYNGRDPLPVEMHIQMLEALGGGAKGFIHYIHSGSTAGGRGGSGTNKPLWDAMGPMHQQIAAVGAVAVRSTPVDWASASDSRIHVDALLCDPANLLVVLINQAIQSTKTDCTVPAIENTKVKVELPTGRSISEVDEVLPGGKLSKIDFQKFDSGIEAMLPGMQEGTILWLKGDSK